MDLERWRGLRGIGVGRGIMGRGHGTNRVFFIWAFTIYWSSQSL